MQATRLRDDLSEAELSMTRIVELYYLNDSEEARTACDFASSDGLPTGRVHIRVPKLLVFLTRYLRDNAKVEGIFRLNGLLKRIRNLTNKLASNYQQFALLDYDGFVDMLFHPQAVLSPILEAAPLIVTGSTAGEGYTPHDLAHFVKKLLIELNSSSSTAVISAGLNMDIQQELNAAEFKPLLAHYAALFEEVLLGTLLGLTSTHNSVTGSPSAAPSLGSPSALSSGDPETRRSRKVSAPELFKTALETSGDVSGDANTTPQDVHTTPGLGELEEQFINKITRLIFDERRKYTADVLALPHLGTLVLMLDLLSAMLQHDATTKMLSLNLSMIFANLLVQSLTLSKQEINLHNYMVYLLIRNYGLFLSRLEALMADPPPLPVLALPLHHTLGVHMTAPALRTATSFSSHTNYSERDNVLMAALPPPTDLGRVVSPGLSVGAGSGLGRLASKRRSRLSKLFTLRPSIDLQTGAHSNRPSRQSLTHEHKALRMTKSATEPNLSASKDDPVVPLPVVEQEPTTAPAVPALEIVVDAPTREASKRAGSKGAAAKTPAAPAPAPAADTSLTATQSAPTAPRSRLRSRIARRFKRIFE